MDDTRRTTAAPAGPVYAEQDGGGQGGSGTKSDGTREGSPKPKPDSTQPPAGGTRGG